MYALDVIIKGPGPGREAAARALAGFFKVLSITDATGIPHNGVRASKERRM
jgi:small subunit ribosomal protein S11